MYLIPLMSAVIALFLCFLVYGQFFHKTAGTKSLSRKINLIAYLGFENFEKEAQKEGWDLTVKELTAIIIFAVSLGVVLAVCFKNPLILMAGLIAGYSLPRFLLDKYKNRKKMDLYTRIPEFGRVLASKLYDHPNIARALEICRDEAKDPIIRPLIDGLVKDINAGMGLTDALVHHKRKVNIKKYDLVIEALVIAHEAGCTPEALRAMEKAVDAISQDILAINTINIEARKKKRELYLVAVVAWGFPLILSLLNTGHGNVYLHTLPGKLLMFFYVMGTIFIIIKGEEYLSLRLEEL